ncbi:MAG: rod shape-determining protein MreD [Mycobacteriales bacterium]
MTAPRLLLGATTVLVALVLQTTALTWLPLPGGGPDLLLVLVVAFALTEGALSGTATGFVTGLLADLVSDHELGRVALAYALVGYLAGLAGDGRSSSRVRPLVTVAAAATGAVAIYALEGLLLGDPRITAAAFGSSLGGTVPYSVLLAPVVVPVVDALLRRVGEDRVGW